MDRAKAASRRGWLPGWLLLCFCSWACLGLLALPALAGAEPAPEYSVPTDQAMEPFLPEYHECPNPQPEGGYEGEDEGAGQIFELRREAAEICKAETDRLDQVVKRLWWVTAEELGEHRLAVESNEWAQEITEKLEGTLQAKVVGGEAGPQPVVVEGGVEVTNPPDVAAVRQAVIDGAETGNQNLWGLAGLAVGFLALAGLYKLVRP